MLHRQIDDPDAAGLTPLHRAACRGATICCRYLMRVYMLLFSYKNQNCGQLLRDVSIKYSHKKFFLLNYFLILNVSYYIYITYSLIEI